MGDGGHADGAGDVGIGHRHQNGAALIRDGDEIAGAVAHVMIDHEQIGVPHQAEHRRGFMIGDRLGDRVEHVGLCGHFAGSLRGEGGLAGCQRAGYI